MLVTLGLGIFLLGVRGQFSKPLFKLDHWVAGLLAGVAVLEALVSVAWTQYSIELRGLWFLAPWTTFPFSINIRFSYPLLEWGHYEVHLWLGHLLVTFVASPSCGVGFADPRKILYSLMVRRAVFPVFLVMNFVPIPLLCLGFRCRQKSQIRRGTN